MRYCGSGGSVKAEGLGDGSCFDRFAIAKLRLTLPPGYSHPLVAGEGT